MINSSSRHANWLEFTHYQEYSYLIRAQAEAELPMRHGGAAAPPTAGAAPLEPPLSSSLPASMERGIAVTRIGGGGRRNLCSVSGR